MAQQITNTVLMVRPAAFRMNEETAVNNFFQEDIQIKNEDINKKAQEEFDSFVELLRGKGINVVIVEDKKEYDTPDSIFPNNWVSFHEDGTAVIYPMFAENRRRERRMEIFEQLEAQGFKIEEVLDYSGAEEEGIFLEGTGSMILDRINQKAYCSLSARADEDLFIEFCEDMEFTPVIFTAYQDVDGERKPIYHTNVMMCLAEEFSVFCLDSIDDPKEKKTVIRHLKEDGKEIIKITESQMHQFAGNMLQVKGANDKKYLVMSTTANKSLNQTQIKAIEKYCDIISADIKTIETCGGGSTRCMMAEVFLPN